MIGNKKKSVVLLVSLVLVLCFAVGASYAWVVDKTNPVPNRFEPGNANIKVTETFANNVKSDVAVKSDANVDVFVRATILVNWVDENGNIAPDAVQASDYRLTMGSSKWVQSSDGYYYYTDKLSPAASTANLIDECKPISGKAPEGYTLEVKILAESIQAGNYTDYATAWGYYTTTVPSATN